MEPENTQITSINADMRFLKGFADWATFKAITDIIFGALSCLSFILILPAIYGVLNIIAGVKLLSASASMKLYLSENDQDKIMEVFCNLHKHFKLSGISIIIRTCGVIILIVFYVLLIMFVIMKGDSLGGLGTTEFSPNGFY
jgi:hypothetical protein